MPDGTEAICKDCYRGKDMERVFIPKSVREIQEGAFFECEKLQEVVFEEESMLKKIGKLAFWNCISLKKINLPEELELIGNWCFFESGFEEISIPNSVT